MNPAIPPIRLLVATAFLAGLAVRFSFLGYATPDTGLYLLPWYEHARSRGLASLGEAFTNYAPFYTYLLVAVTWLDGLAAPLTLIKSISYPFEFGCALVAARLARLSVPEGTRAPAIAFAAVWLAPSVLHNGAFWGQCDAIWTFFVLLSVWGACRERPRLAILAFGFAVSVKLQAVFIGPFLLGIVLRNRTSLLWFALVPAVYLVLALPALLAGRPLAEVLTIYLDQADAYRSLSKGAANLYLMMPEELYRPGMALGIALAGLCGLYLSRQIARAPHLSTEQKQLAAAVSLLAMPFLLPKMHERFFYPFEVAILVLACRRPPLAAAALAAQVTSLLAYMPFDGRGDFGQVPAGLQNLILLLFLAILLRRSLEGGTGPAGEIVGDFRAFIRPSAAMWFAYLAYSGVAAAGAAWFAHGPAWPAARGDLAGLALFGLALVGTITLLRRAERASEPVRPAG